MLDWKEIDKLPLLKQQVYWAFRTLQPRLAAFPHRIAAQEARFAEAVLDVVGGRGGLWGRHPRFDEHGADGHIGPESDEQAPGFHLWRRPDNQADVASFLRRGNDALQIALLIDLETPQDLLIEMDREIKPFDDYDYYIEKVADWLPRLGWAYFAIEYEGEFAMFVTASEKRHLVEELQEKLQIRGIPSTALELGADGDWLLPPLE